MIILHIHKKLLVQVENAVFKLGGVYTPLFNNIIMSRSYKKHPIIKDKDKDFQKIGNRKFRRKSKQKNKLSDPDAILPIDKSEVINDYDVTDWLIIDADEFLNKRKKRGKKINK